MDQRELVRYYTLYAADLAAIRRLRDLDPSLAMDGRSLGPVIIFADASR